jgi:uncharacterized protein (DUF302 family)
MLPTPAVKNYQAHRVEVELDVSYAAFARAFEELLGTMDLDVLRELMRESPEEARKKFATSVGPLGFALFQKIDHGSVLTLFTGGQVRATSYIFGNALTAVEMTKHEPRVGLYLPIRLFVREIPGSRVLVTYDRPSSLLAQFESPEVDEVARGLDEKVVVLLDQTVKRAATERAVA